MNTGAMKFNNLSIILAFSLIFCPLLFPKIVKVDKKAKTIQIGSFAWRKGANDVSIFFTENTDSCKVIQTQRLPKNGSVLWITIKDYSKIGRDYPQPGIYPVREGKQRIKPREAKKIRIIKDCDLNNIIVAIKGVVTINKMNLKPGGWIEGYYDITLSDSKKELKQTFKAKYCPIPENMIEGWKCEE